MPASNCARSSRYMPRQANRHGQQPGGLRRQVVLVGVGPADHGRQAVQRGRVQGEVIEDGIERAVVAAMGQRDALDVKGTASKRSATAATSPGATNRNRAAGSMKRRISQGQAMRSILGRCRVTQEAASRAGRRRASGAAPRPPSPRIRPQGFLPERRAIAGWQRRPRTVCAVVADHDGAAARRDRVCADVAVGGDRLRSRDQARVFGKVVRHADVDQDGRVGRADQPGQLRGAEMLVKPGIGASSGRRDAGGSGRSLTGRARGSCPMPV